MWCVKCYPLNPPNPVHKLYFKINLVNNQTQAGNSSLGAAAATTLFFHRFQQSVGTTAIFGSILIILLSAFDRFEAVTRPMKFRERTNTQLHVCVAGSWILAILLSIPQVFICRIHTIG